MKGLMVPLLTICMTGMVMGQQPQNSTNPFGNSIRNASPTGQPRSILSGNRSNSASPGFSGSSPESVRQSGPLEMGFSDQLIEQFQQRGQASAEISPREFVNEIVFFHDSRNSSELKPARIIPVSKTNETLRFELDDNDLQSIRQQGLSYKFDRFEQGRFAQVIVDYKNSNSSRENSIFRSTGSTQPLNEGGGFGASSANSNFVPPPSPDFARPYDPQYMGPTIPRNLANHRRDSNSTIDNSKWTDLSGNGQQRSPSGNTQYPNTPSTASSQTQNVFSETGRQPSSTIWSNRDSGMGSVRTADNRQKFQPLSNVQPLNSGNNQPFGNSDEINSSQLSQAELMQKELERKQAEAMQRNIRLRQQKLAELEQKNRLEERAIIEQRRAMEQIRSEMERRNDSRNHDVSSRSFGASGSSQSFDNADRLAASMPGNYSDQLVNGSSTPTHSPGFVTPQPTNNGVRSMAAAIQGPQSLNQGNSNRVAADPRDKLVADANRRNEEKTEGIIYFMLLFSLGLNVYLGWISRGFYIRYNELADELRETFTATM